MGLPICLYAFGERGLALAMVYFTVCTIGQFSFGPGIAMGRLTVGGLFRVPFLYAAMLAVTCAQMGFASPQWLTNTLTMIGNLTIPLMLLGLGVALAQLVARNKARQFTLALARLALGLAGGLGVSWLFGLQGAERGVLIIQSAMPTAVFNYLFRARPRLGPGRSRRDGPALDARLLRQPARHRRAGDVNSTTRTAHAPPRQ